MAELKYKPVPHDHKAFLAKARARKGCNKAYDALAMEYQVAGQMLKARSRAGFTQDASAVGCELQVKLVRQKAT